MDQTDIVAIRAVAKSMIDDFPLDLTEDDINYPFSGEMIGVPTATFAKGSAVKQKAALASKIENSNFDEIVAMIDSRYLLYFLCTAYKSISPTDLGEIINKRFQPIEYVSKDANSTVEKLVFVFQHASKDTMMDEEGKKIYDSLPERVTLYRGVTYFNKDYTKAISWTRDKEVAKWFASRFSVSGTGEVWTISIPKKRVLCTFSGPEQTVIINSLGCKARIQAEKPDPGDNEPFAYARTIYNQQ